MLVRALGASLLAATMLTPAAFAQERVVTVGTANISDTIDPGRDHSNVGSQNMDLAFDSLIRRDYDTVDLVFEPALAESWTFVSPEVLELTLRTDVVFHNGAPMTADDVVFSLMRIIDADYAPYVSIRRQFFESLERVEAVDDYTVRVHTSRPDPALLTLLSTTQAAIVPADYVREVGFEAFGTAPIGTGPFRVTAIESGNRIVFDRFDAFWGDAPEADQVVLRRIPETGPRVTALINGEVDIITNVPPDQVALIEQATGVRAIEFMTPGFHVMTYNTNHPVLTRPVRQAMNFAIDRQLLSDALWQGRARVPNGHQYPQFGDLYDADRPAVPFDPERARQLVAESGYAGEPIRIDAFAVYYTNGLLAAQAIAEMWNAVGLNAHVNVILPGTPLDGETMARAWSNPLYFPDPAGSFGTMWSPSGARVPLSWNVETENYAEAYDAFRYELDTDRRRELYGVILDIVDEEAPFAILYNPVEYYGASERVEWAPQPGAQPYTLNFRAGAFAFADGAI